MQLPKATVDVLRYRVHDDDLQTDRSGVAGYQASCPCGWKGERRFVIATAHRDKLTHLEQWHTPPNERTGA